MQPDSSLKLTSKGPTPSRDLHLTPVVGAGGMVEHASTRVVVVGTAGITDAAIGGDCAWLVVEVAVDVDGLEDGLAWSAWAADERQRRLSLAAADPAEDMELFLNTVALRKA